MLKFNRVTIIYSGLKGGLGMLIVYLKGKFCTGSPFK